MEIKKILNRYDDIVRLLTINSRVFIFVNFAPKITL